MSLPDPASASGLPDLVDRLRLLKVWAGNPSYEAIKERINAAWAAAGRPASELARRSTVAYCFRPGRRRLDTELVLAVVGALHPDTGYVTQWRQALRVIGGETEAASQVRVQDRLPADLAGFTGRTGELDHLLRAARDGPPVVISSIAGMAGVGKTELAVHFGHLLHRQQPFERVLFVNLRGFDPDPLQPPADPAAILDGFLRLLGVPAQQIPHDLAGRAATFRDRLTSTRALVVLDNAASTEQVRPLLPATEGCLTLVTSRRRLTDLQPATHLTVDPFTPGEARAFLDHAVPGSSTAPDAQAADRIARRCGYLPLALGLIARHILGTPSWTLTDHADRLDERHHDRRLDTGIDLALTQSYRHLPAGRQRLLRLLALHPGRDFDTYAAAALTGTGTDTARSRLRQLRDDHLLQDAGAGRYTFHDLVRAYATVRAADEEPPPARREALTRLFDLYLAASGAAMNTLYPAEATVRPPVRPAGTPVPDLTVPGRARRWLDTERSTLIAVAVHAATHGWPAHTVLLSRLLQRHLATGSHNADALTLHDHGYQAAVRLGDTTGQATALLDIGFTYGRLGDHGRAAASLQRAAQLFRTAGSPTGQRRAPDVPGDPTDRSVQALTLFQQLDDRLGEAYAREGLGLVHLESGRTGSAAGHLRRALTLFRQTGDPAGETWTLEGLGLLHARLGDDRRATGHQEQALAVCRATGDRIGEARVLNSLGETARTFGRPADSLSHHAAARAVAADTGDRPQEARALTGIGHAHRALGDLVLAREHHRQALSLYTGLGRPEVYQIRAHLSALPGDR